MRLVRFVTEEELNLYLSGKPVINTNDHRKKGNNSTSVGSCFAEITKECDADKWNRKLAAIRPCEYCIEFETTRFKATLNQSHATYLGNSKEDIYNLVTRRFREWCTTEYSLTTHPYTRIGKCPGFGGIIVGEGIDWNWQTKEIETPEIQLVIGWKTYNVTEGLCKDCALNDFCDRFCEDLEEDYGTSLCLANALGNEFNNGKKKTFCFKEE